MYSVKPLYLTAIKNSLIISVVSAVIGLAVAFVGGRAACEKGAGQSGFYGVF